MGIGPPFPRTAAHFPDCRLCRAGQGKAPRASNRGTQQGARPMPGLGRFGGSAPRAPAGPPPARNHTEARPAKTIRLS